jgi:sirohydrochlorin ferrochelatase
MAVHTGLGRGSMTLPVTGHLLCGHGSREPASVEGFACIAAGLAPLLPDRPFAYGFMELAPPSLDAAIGLLAGIGATRILAVPGFLFAARHVQADLPRLLAAAAARYRIELHLGRELGLDERLVAALAERIADAEGSAGAASRGATALVLVGAGSSHADANARLARLADRLAAEWGFGQATAAFASVTRPTVACAIEAATQDGFRRVLLLPWFLTEGSLLDRARAVARAAVSGRAELLEAAVLGAHPLVLEALAARAAELAAAVPG